MLRVFGVKGWYHLRKPRVQTEVDKAYAAYCKELAESRKNIHRESVEYLNQIEDAYLSEHKKAMRKQHFQNQCAFRKQIFTDAYRLLQNQRKWEQEDARFNSALNKHLHDEDVRKINRSRILKIMQHQSEHYWFNQDNVETRLKEESIFPEYVASSEYYYRLFAEAMAYELGDFNQLHLVTSNEEIIRQKNKYLIPLYLTLRNKINQFSKDPIMELQKKMRVEISLVQKGKTAQESSQEVGKIREQYEKEMGELREEKEKDRAGFLKKRVRQMISIFKTWKEYTNVLALTSSQVIKNQYDHKNEGRILTREREVLQQLKKKDEDSFVDSVEEDTEEETISFEEYLAKIKQQSQELGIGSQSETMEELDLLFSQSDHLESDPSLQSKNLNLSSVVRSDSREVNLDKGGEVNQMFLNPKETTASVQILKGQFKEDPEMVKLLNQLGEIDVKYPRLFQQIWKSCSQ